MGIEFRSSDVGMSEQRLHGPQVCPVLQHVSGATVPEHVRADLALDSRRMLTDNLANPLAGKLLPAVASVTNEKPGKGLFLRGEQRPHRQIALQSQSGRL